MRDTRDARGARRVGWVILGACTLWLVVQNSLLLLAVLWIGPDAALAGGSAVLKAGARLLGDPLRLTVIAMAAGISLGLIARTLAQTGHERRI